MATRKRVFIGIGTGLGLLVICILVLAQLRFGAVLPAPRVTAAEWSSNQNAIRLLIHPQRATAIIHSALGEQAPPAWIIPPFMPYEAALLLNADPDTATCTAEAFVNLRRLEPLAGRQLAALSLPESLGLFTLPSESPVIRQPGVIALRAQAPIQDTVIDRAARYAPGGFGENTGTEKRDAFLDLSIDNRAGCLYTLVGMMISAGYIDLSQANIEEDALAQFLAIMGTIEFAASGDLDTLSAKLVVTASKTATERDVASLETLFTFFGHYTERTIRDLYNVDIEWSIETEENRVIGNYTVTGLRPLVARMTAAPPELEDQSASI